MTSKIILPHKCPKCGKVANTYQELEELFGFRNMTSKSVPIPKEVRNQS